jgi:hypothetical protein
MFFQRRDVEDRSRRFDLFDLSPDRISERCGFADGSDQIKRGRTWCTEAPIDGRARCAVNQALRGSEARGSLLDTGNRAKKVQRAVDALNPPAPGAGGCLSE